MIYLVKFLLWLLSLLPAGGPYWIAHRAAGLWMRLSPVKRHTTERNLERCYPDMGADERETLVRESFVHYLCSVLETGHNWYWPVDKLQARCVEFVNEDLFVEALENGRGTVVLAPHFGAWEYLGLYLQRFPGIAILYKPPSNPGLEKALLASRRRGGGHLIAANGSGIRKLYAHIKGGGSAGVLPDQQPSRGQGRFAPFFGQALAAICERMPGGRYRVHCLPVPEDIHSPDLDVALAAVNRAVENCIAVNPAQYLWSYRRFKKQPEEAPPFYDFK